MTVVSQCVADGKRVIWVTDRVARAVCQANRQAAIRACWVVDVATMNAAISEIQPNVVVIHPERISAAEWPQMVRVWLG